MCLLTCAVDHRDPSEIVRPRVSMTACIEAFAAPERVTTFTAQHCRPKVSHRSEYYEQTCVALPESLAIPRERRVRYSTILDRTGLKSAGEIGI